MTKAGASGSNPAAPLPVQPGGGFLGAWHARVGNPIDWSPVDKVLGVGLIVFVFLAWWTAMLTYIVRHPALAPFADAAGVARMAWLLGAITAAYLAVCGAAVALRRRRPDSAALVYAHALLYGLLCCVAAYCLGLYTNLISGALIVGGFGVGLILWDARPIVLTLALALVVLLGITIADQAGMIRYAPILQDAPFREGRLSPVWLVSIGGSSLAAMAMFLSILYLVIRRWQERDEMLARTSEQLARANDLISRYVAAQVTEQIFAGNYGAVERHDRCKLTLFFSDIKGFTAMADRLEPEETSQLLNRYLSEMTAIAHRHGATIDKFIGDALMVFFGAPVATEDRDHAVRAVRMAVEMQDRVVELSDHWREDGLLEEPFQIRIGINTGLASVGNFGSRERMDYTAIGRQVNLAARLQASCSPGKILLSHATWVLVKDQFPCTEQGELRVKGMERPVKVYEVAS